MPRAVCVVFSGEVPPRSFDTLTQDLGWPSFPIDPLELPAVSDGLSLADQAAHWAGRIVATDSDPIVLFGYCAAYPLLTELVDQLRRRGAQVDRLVVWDPQTVAAADVVAAVREICHDLEPDLAEQAGDENDLAAADLAELRRKAAATLASVVDRALAELPDDVRRQLLDRYLRWVGYLTAAAATAPAGLQPTDLVVLSDEAPEAPPVGPTVVRVTVSAPGPQPDVVAALRDGPGSVHA